MAVAGEGRTSRWAALSGLGWGASVAVMVVTMAAFAPALVTFGTAIVPCSGTWEVVAGGGGDMPLFLCVEGGARRDASDAVLWCAAAAWGAGLGALFAAAWALPSRWGRRGLQLKRWFCWVALLTWLALIVRHVADGAWIMLTPTLAGAWLLTLSLEADRRAVLRATGTRGWATVRASTPTNEQLNDERVMDITLQVEPDDRRMRARSTAAVSVGDRVRVITDPGWPDEIELDTET